MAITKLCMKHTADMNLSSAEEARIDLMGGTSYSTSVAYANSTVNKPVTSFTDPIVVLEGGRFDTINGNWYICFHTAYGFPSEEYSDVLQDTVDISVMPSLVPKYNAANNRAYDPNSYSKHTQYDYWRNFTRAEWINAGGTVTGDVSKGFDWTIPITSIVSEMNDGGKGQNVMQFFTNGESRSDYRSLFNYATRVCDAMQFDIKVATNYQDLRSKTPNKIVHSEVARISQHLEFAPKYTLEAHSEYGQWVHYTEEGLWIPYTCNDWIRPNDRFAVDTDIYVGNSCVVRADKNVWGTVKWYGRLLIPASKVNAIPATGSTITSGLIRFNAVYRTRNTDFSSMDLSGAYFYTDTEANTPSGYATVDNNAGTVTLYLSDTGDKNSPIVTYDVRLYNYNDFYEEGLDHIRVFNTGDETKIVFYEPPWGRNLQYQIVGFNNEGNASQPSYINTQRIYPDLLIPMPGVYEESDLIVQPTNMNGLYRFRSVNDPRMTLRIKFNVSDSETRTPSVETMKLSGRRFESAFYGDGGSGSIKLSGILVLDDTDVFSPYDDVGKINDEAYYTHTDSGGIFHNDYYDKIEEGVYYVLTNGPCYLRRADGRRAYVAVTDISVNSPRTMPNVISVDISCTRVS